MLDRTIADHSRPDTIHLDPFLRKLSHTGSLTASDVDALRMLDGRHRMFAAGDVILKRGTRLLRPMIVISGWVTRAVHLVDGARQIVGFSLPGDFLAGYPARRHFSFSTASAIRPTEILELDASALTTVIASHPALAEAIEWTADRDFWTLARTVERIGRRPARNRIAHLLIELSFRLELTGQLDPEILPLRQQDVADACGLSLVHVNKTLGRYQAEGLIAHRRGALEIIDMDGLSALADFSRDAFLNLE